MSATKLDDLTLTIQKATEGFTEIVDRPTDNDLIKICQLLVPVLMKTKYDDLILTHNLSGVILPSERYQQIYKKGDYLTPPVIALYDETIEKYATIIEVHRAESKHEARRNDQHLYKTADNACRILIMALVYETWYKEIEDPGNFYTKVTDLKLLNQLTEFCAGLHTVDAVNIPQLMKSLYKDSDGVPQFINAMEAAQRKPKRAKLVIKYEYLHAVALKSLLQSGDYETETSEWSKLPEDKKPWADWKNTFRAAYVGQETIVRFSIGRTETFWWFYNIWCGAHRKRTAQTGGSSTNVAPNDI